MAITGTGAQNDPYLVHSYDELKTVTTDNSYCPQYEHRYISLDADIDCNVYGSQFEWETIALGHDSRGFTLDLNEHTIKNISVKFNNSIFDASYAGTNVYGSWYSEFVGNGKILNVFTQPSSTAYVIKSRGYQNTVSNLSISASLGANSKGLFLNTKISDCAIYAESGSTPSDGEAVILYSTVDADASTLCDISNCDILLNLNGMNNHVSWSSTSAIGTNVLINNTRLRGFIKSSDLKTGWLSIGKLSNCVVDLDMSEANWGGVSYILKWSCSDGSNGVINVDNMPVGQLYEAYFTRGMTSVNSSEIVNGDALRAKGFTVVNVVG